MDRGATDLTNALPSPFSHYGESRPEVSPLDSQQHFTTQPETRQSQYSTTATPTSEFGTYPASARSATFDYTRQYQPSTSVGAASMATNSSLIEDGAAHQDPQQDAQHVKSDSDVPIDPSIAAHSPSQYTYGHQTSPYSATAPDMSGHAAYTHSGVYGSRPDWAGYTHTHTPITPNHHAMPFAPQAPPANQGRPNQVYSFVPIPGAQQHKRPRRRYEEIERMYKCGWNGCEKAYGTLNHLNAHVTMQSHGQKRIPEEFKEIRKEWKARKKAEEAERKQRDEQVKNGEVTQDAQRGQNSAQNGTPTSSYVAPSAHGMPSMGYSTGAYTVANAPVTLAGAGSEYSSNYVTANTYPSSPYTQSHQQVYGQPNGGQAH